MEILIDRSKSIEGTTLGDVYLDGVHQWFSCEDEIRPPGVKVPGATCIPPGRYQVEITQSAKFGCKMPLVLSVPGFSGIRIHSGNTAADTEGCILVGGAINKSGPQISIAHSKDAFRAIYARIKDALDHGEPVWLTIVNPMDLANPGALFA